MSAKELVLSQHPKAVAFKDPEGAWEIYKEPEGEGALNDGAIGEGATAEDAWGDAAKKIETTCGNK